MREYVVENAFRDEVARQGGLALKFSSQTMNGVPDRLVLLPGGKVGFVELKAPGKQMRPLQVKRKQQLEALGFPVYCVDRHSQICEVIDAIRNYRPGDSTEGVGAQVPVLERVAQFAERMGDVPFIEADPFELRDEKERPKLKPMPDDEVERAAGFYGGGS